MLILNQHNSTNSVRSGNCWNSKITCWSKSYLIIWRGYKTARVETIVAPNIYVVKRGIVIGYATKLDSRSGGVSTKRNLSWNTTLPTTTIGVVGTPQMVFTNSIMTIHVNRNLGWPPMSSMVARGYKSVDATNSRGRY